MSFSDDVRNYCIAHFIIPARNRGENSVSIRAGDVHRDMNYRNRLPLVCSAIGTKSFQEMAHIQRISIEGPANGANTVFTFKIM